MISKDKLLKVKKIIVHKYCHDGMSSAMIIRDVLPDVEVFFAEHKDPEYLEMDVEEGLLFCDIAPPPKRGAQFMKARAIVLDHHEKTEKVVRRFAQVGLGALGDNSNQESGAVLAYRHVWIPLQDRAKTEKYKVCRVSRLAGIRDTYFKDSIEWEEACIQTEALAFFPEESWLDKDHSCEILEQELAIGLIQHNRFQSIVKRAVDQAYIFEWNNIKVAILSGYRVISDASEELRKQGVSITLAFSFKTIENKNHLTVSTRSDDSIFNCNLFCAEYGGGGHPPAAGGIMLTIEDDSLNPYTVLKNMLKENGHKSLVNPDKHLTLDKRHRNLDDLIG